MSVLCVLTPHRCLKPPYLASDAPKKQLGSRYNTDAVETRQERKEARAKASLQALDRGDVGCLMSPVDIARAMSSLLRMHQSEFEMQV